MRANVRLILLSNTFNMVHLSTPHLPHHKDGRDTQPKKEITCSHCGRQLMERRGVLRRMKPVSNAFVLYGHCLACHSAHSTEEEEVRVEGA